MHGARNVLGPAALWKTFAIVLVVAVALAEGFLSITAPLVAQTPAAPAVRVRRDYQLGGGIWPVDLNRDGITDLVSTSPSNHVQVSIGKGDGTFNAPVESSFEGGVLATGDFNGDRRPDVVAARTTNQAIQFVILPGTGTATLGPAVTVASVDGEFAFALSADFDGDGKRDLVLPGPGGAALHPGNGDFTFGTPVQLVTNGENMDGIVADLDNDGRPDIVTANGEIGTVSIFLNHGSLTFAAADLHLARETNDVSVADVDHDGRLDLLVAAGTPASDGGPGSGFVMVFHGNGDGTFAAPVEYPVAAGPRQIVVGDFNRDGVIDVVTGNWPAIVRDDCTSEIKTWDSASVLVGLPNGTFTGLRNFSIGDQSVMDISDPQVDRYRHTLISLNTSDLNGDGATDLIASHGAILFNIPAVPNRPPTVNAGPDQVLLNDHSAVFRPPASDPDEDVLTYEIRVAPGTFVAGYPNACSESAFQDGDNTVTVTVNDGQGHTASDSAVYTVVRTTGNTGQFAAGTDIGDVGAAGGDAFDSAADTYTVRGSGSDIWGTADEFHYLWTKAGGNFEVTARVDSVQNVNAWTKAGIMIRANLNPGSAHASLFATPAKGVAFQRRPAENGITVHTAGPATTAPVWLKLQRTGTVVIAYYRKATTDAWTEIDRQTLGNLPSDVLVGLAVSSHVDGQVASASFSRVAIQRALPWTGRSIGTGTGSFTTQGVTVTATGRGVDIWGSADAFFYVSIPYENDVTLTARVKTITGAEAWAKAGVMIREDLTAGSRHVMVVVTPGKGVAMQYRPASGAASVQAADVPGAAPAWVRLVRHGGTFTASWSADGEHWTTLGSVNVPFAATQFYIGLPITSHNAASSASVTFDDVSVQ
jgi:regulation of enolase protein 1 (concanavalin A-like superfamily)